jgi:hypothetical protein
MTKVFRSAGNLTTVDLYVVERTVMQMIGRATRVVTLTGIVTLIGTLGYVQFASGAPIVRTIASYKGETIDLSQGWGTASVCAVTAAGTNCFASQGGYQSWLSSQSGLAGDALVSSLTNCSSGLDLFQNINYGGNELVILDQSIWINLSAYSFSDEVSSYQVGACSISMTDAPNGGGNVYPGATSAGSDVPWIGTAWNDRIQSVYVY